MPGGELTEICLTVVDLLKNFNLELVLTNMLSFVIDAAAK
jgi:hypothetical protein